MKKTLQKMRGKLFLEYDETKYDIDYVDDIPEYKIFIKRLSDGKIIGIFNDTIEYIIHCYKNDKDNFIVADDSIENKYSGILMHFVDEKGKILSLKEQYCCSSKCQSINRLEERVFIVSDDSYGKCLYNLEKRSKKFRHIYKDKKINECLGKNVVMVEEIKRPFWPHDDEDIHDTITYGINIETYEIVTPIWSNLQQRFIPIYTKKDIEQLEEKYMKKGQYFYIRDTENLGDITIEFEVQKYLNLLSSWYPERENVYSNSEENNLNVEFIKKFKKEDV